MRFPVPLRRVLGIRVPVQNELKFTSFADFKKNYFMPFLTTFQKLAVEKGVAKDDKDMKEKGKKMANNAAKWIKAHFDELQFYSLESYYRDGTDVDEKYKDLSFAANLAYVRYEGTDAYFYFLKVRARCMLAGTRCEPRAGGVRHVHR
jgi:hypothetical protein